MACYLHDRVAASTANDACRTCAAKTPRAPALATTPSSARKARASLATASVLRAPSKSGTLRSTTRHATPRPPVATCACVPATPVPAGSIASATAVATALAAAEPPPLATAMKWATSVACTGAPWSKGSMPSVHSTPA
eukprot:3350298-Pleurochrysis_carterae.AAC.1